MKNYSDVVYAQNQFEARRNAYLQINYEFYLNLINQIVEKSQIPPGALTKFQAGTNENINIVEEWISLDDTFNCSMSIAINFDGISHRINFESKKVNNYLTLNIEIGSNSNDFEFDLHVLSPENIDFTEVINYIFETIESIYDSWQF